MKTPINARTIRQHMLYNSWKYVLLVIVTLVGWNLIFTMSAYRPPAEKIIDLYIYGSVETENMQAYWDELHQREFPEMEQMNVSSVIQDETYGDMVMMARIAAGEGDIYVLPKSTFSNYAGQGYLVNLDDCPQVMEVTQSLGMNLERGTYRNVETGIRNTYGVPMVLLPRLQSLLGLRSSDYVVCIMVNNANDDNVIPAFASLIRDMAAAEDAATATDLTK